MKHKISLLLTIVCILSCFALGADEYAEGFLLVKFDSGVSTSQRQQILNNAGGGTIVREYQLIPWVVVELPSGCTVSGKLGTYNATSGISKAEPNFKRYRANIPNDALFSQLWGLQNTGQAGGTPGADISAVSAWDITTGSSNIVVAVTDSGVDYTHDDLADNMWVNTDELNGTDGVDDDDNGYIDDIYGWDSGGEDVENPDDADGDPAPPAEGAEGRSDHGTHVAGTIGAVGNNGVGVVGVCWDVSIMAVKIFADNSNFTIDSEQIAGIEYAIVNGAHVINASWGGFGFSQSVYDIIQVAQSEGIIFVAAAGNETNDNDAIPAYPASYNLDNIISVLATGRNDSRASFSNWGLTTVDIGAPGVSILSTVFEDGYGSKNGTSMASPHVAGACAIMLANKPYLTYTEVKEILLETVDPVPALDGLIASGGRMNLYEALIYSPEDIQAPTPDPAEWQTWGKPKATGPGHIAMEVLKAVDDSGGAVEYQFECVTDDSFSSDWQSSKLYQRNDVIPGTTYKFRVRARDESNNITDWSQIISVTTPAGPDDPCSPFPDPAQWSIPPRVIRLTPVKTIRMQARAALDHNTIGIEYSFRCVTDSAYDSGWQSSNTYNIADNALVDGESYTFAVKAKDGSGNETNETLGTVTIGLNSSSILTVPEPYPTIEAAIEAAKDGDIVEVRQGTYAEHDLDFDGKAITVRSTDPGDPAITASTIVNCNNQGRGFIFKSGEGQDSLLTGFTITGGLAPGKGADGVPLPGDPNASDGESSYGGGIYCEGSSPTIKNCIITNCRADASGGDAAPGDPTTDPVTPGGKGGNGNKAMGGGIYCDGTSSPIIENCTITGCQVISNGGDGGDGVVDIDPDNPEGTGGIGGDAPGNIFGAGIALDVGSSAVIRNCTINDNTAVEPQGGAGGIGDTMGSQGSGGGQARAGGIYGGLGTGIPVINNTKINSNNSGNDGGGIYFETASNTTVTITDCQINDNYTEDDGGGVYAEGSDGSVLEFVGTDIIGNEVFNYDGGGIWFATGDGTLKLDKCNISNNITINVNDDGGGIFAGNLSNGNGTIVDINESLIGENISEYGGGLYLVETMLSMKGTTLTGNSAFEGAGIFAFNCDINEVNDCLVNENTADKSGGGFAAINCHSVIRNSVFTENEASNTADSSGGAIAFEGSSNSFAPNLLENCLFVDNAAGADGGAVSNKISSWLLINNCTFAGNSTKKPTGAGGAVSCAEYWAYVQIENSILWDNQSQNGPQIAVGSPEGSNLYGDGPYADVEVWYSDVQGGPDDVWLEDPSQIYTAFWWLDGNIDADPNFISVGMEKRKNYYLSHIPAGQDVNSPCIDAGDPSATLDTSNLTTRTDHVADTGIVDMGFHVFVSGIINEYTLTIQVDMEGFHDEPGGLLKAQKYGLDPCTIFADNTPNDMTVTQGSVVDLTALPDVNHVVSYWMGADNVPAEGEISNTVLMDSDKLVKVVFSLDGFFYLITNVDNTGDNGDGKIFYFDEKSGDWVEHVHPTMHHEGTTVQLNAEPGQGYETYITHWSGTDDDDTISRQNSVKMNYRREVIVTFREARILNVPDDYQFIQTAIDDALPGDTVMLAPGEYDKDNNFAVWIIEDKPITLTSTDPDDPEVVAQTVMRVKLGIYGVDRSCVIQGLTFENMHYGARGGFNGGTEENPFPDGTNGIPVVGGAIQLHDTYFMGSSEPFPTEPQPGSSPIIRNCVFRNTSVEGSDGGEGGSVDNVGGDGGWGGWARGGAISLGADSSPLIENCTFQDCYARGGDGGNGNQSTPFGRGGQWSQTELGTGWFWGPYDEYIKYSGYGGAIFIDVKSAPEIKDCLFVDNKVYGGASGVGGGPVLPNAHWRIPRFGGAVYCADDSAPVFENCTFIDNNAVETGPDIWDWDGWHGSAEDVTDQIHEHLSYGGAVAFEDSAMPTFVDCNFVNNNASIGGAMHSSWAMPELYTCDFNNNSGGLGGAVLMIGGSGYIEECTFTSNEARHEGGYGGGLAILGANTDVRDSQFMENVADGSGGGIYISSKDVDGDDISQLNMVSLENCLIAKNSADFSGGGIASTWNARANIQQCTIAENFATGVGSFGGGLVSSNGSYTLLTDSILWDNGSGNGAQIAVRPESRPAIVVAKYSDIEGGTVYTQSPSLGGNIWVDGGNNIYWPKAGIIGNDPDDHDPLFVSGLLGDYYLSQTATGGEGQTDNSPAVDAGSDTAFNLQMHKYTTRTDEVLDGGQVDMGFHYKESFEKAQCKFCDLELDGSIDMYDLALFCLLWLDSDCSADNDWCNGADFNFDYNVDMMDYAIITGCEGTEDRLPPIPDPPKWKTSPRAVSGNAVEMGAVIAVDGWFGEQTDDGETRIEYEFKCVTDPNFDRGFSTDPNYTTAGLTAGREYAFRFRVRDGKHNMTKWSNIASANVGAEEVPITPDPMLWETNPYQATENSIIMEAAQASGPSFLVYLFRDADTQEILAEQTDPIFEHTGLMVGLTYRYQCAAMNPFVTGTYRMNEWSEIREVTMGEFTPPDEQAPITNEGRHIGSTKADFSPDGWPDWGSDSGGFYHFMTAAGTDDESQPVQYKFICVSNDDFSSHNTGAEWRENPAYIVYVSSQTSLDFYIWQVQTRDSSTQGTAPDGRNYGQLSDMYNCKGQWEPYP